jgi:hypothetical protein
MKVESAGATIKPCETDLVIISEKGHYDNLLGIAVGECKARRGEISAEDVTRRWLIGSIYLRSGDVALSRLTSGSAAGTTA